MGTATVPLAQLSFISCDASGLLYGLITAGDLAGCIAVCDVRDKLLEQQQVPHWTLTELNTCSILHPKPTLSFTATGLVVAPTGRYVAVSGYDPEEEDQAIVVVVDVHGGQPLQTASASPAVRQATPSARKSGASAFQAEKGRHKGCPSHVVHYSLFASRPGLLVRQVLWHPYSESHLLLLTSDSRARLYHVSNLKQAETTLHLQCNSSNNAGTPSKYGLIGSGLSTGAGEEAMSVAWGNSTGWGPFTLYVQSSTGGVYAVCPVTASGMRCASSILQQLNSTDAGPDFLAWLHAAFGVHDTNLLPTENWWTALPHVVEGLSPALQGPLNQGCESVQAARAPCVAMAAVHHQQLAGRAGLAVPSSLAQQALPPVATTTALVSGRADGRLWAHLLMQQVGPCWNSAQPGVEGTPTGVVFSVRYGCSSPAHGSPADGSAVLLDAVDLHLPATTVLQSAFDASDDEESADARQGSGMQLSLCTLSAAGSHMVLASHASGSWVVGIPWLPAAAQHLAGRRAQGSELPVLPAPSVQQLLTAGPAGGDGQLLAACSIQDVFLGRVALLLQHPGLLHCMRPGTTLTATESAVKMTAGAATGSSKAATGVAASSQQGTVAVTPGAGGAKGKSTDAIEQALRAVYGDLLNPPVAAPLPAAKGAGSAELQGAAYLSAAIRALRQGGVETAHRTHAGLMQRAGQLNKEAEAHKASAAELQKLCTSLGERQAQLATRAERAAALHANLAERAALLTQMHWSLPRPMSDAEQQLMSDLDVMGSRQATLASRWAGLQARANNLLHQRGSHKPISSPEAVSSAISAISRTPTPSGLTRPAAAGVAGGVSPISSSMHTLLRLPATQMPAVHKALSEHMAAISTCSADLTRMQQQLKAWAEQTACSEVEAQLGGL